MIEFNCQLFLNQYLKNDTKLRYSQENKNALLILDTRPSLNLILVIRNALDKIKKVNLIVVGNKEVFDLVDQHIGKEYFKVNIDTHKIPLSRYNNIMITLEILNSCDNDSLGIYEFNQNFITLGKSKKNNIILNYVIEFLKWKRLG